MLTTKFRIWLQDPQMRPDWNAVQLVDNPRYLDGGCIEVTVKGNGQDLRHHIAQRRDMFAAYLQMKPENHHAGESPQ